MSLMALFSAGNPGNPDKKTGVTATDHAAVSGNPGNPGNLENTTVKVKNVVCYSPLGCVFEVEASSPAHAEFLKRMNPPPMNKELSA